MKSSYSRSSKSESKLNGPRLPSSQAPEARTNSTMVRPQCPQSTCLLSLLSNRQTRETNASNVSWLWNKWYSFRQTHSTIYHFLFSSLLSWVLKDPNRVVSGWLLDFTQWKSCTQQTAYPPITRSFGKDLRLEVTNSVYTLRSTLSKLYGQFFTFILTEGTAQCALPKVQKLNFCSLLQ